MAIGSVNGNTQLRIQLTADGSDKVKAEIGAVAEELKKVREAADETKESTARMTNSMEVIKRIAETWGLFEIVKEIGKAFGEANAEANRFVTSLIAVTGTLESAKAAYEEIHSVVRSTGETTEAATQAWMKLANVGITPTAELLKSLAGVAVATGKSVDDVAQSFAMSAEGHSRGLSQLGIAAKDAGDKVLVSFQGQSQIIDKTKAGIEEYILSIGQTPAAIEAMNAKLNTSAGAWDQLKKAAGDLFETLGGGGSGKAGWFTSMEQGATGYLDKLNAIIQQQGILAGISGVMALGNGQALQFAAMGAAAQSAREELEKMKPTLDDVGGAFDTLAAQIANAAGVSGSMIPSIASALSSFGDIRGKINDAMKQAADVSTATAAVQSHVDALNKQAATMGMGEAAAARYNRTMLDTKLSLLETLAPYSANIASIVAKAKAESDAEIKAAAAADARRAAIKAETDETSRVKSARDMIDRLNEEIQAVGTSTEYHKYLTTVREADRLALPGYSDKIKELAGQLLEAAKAERALADEQKARQEMQKYLQDQIKAEEEVQKRYDAVMGKVDENAAALNKFRDAVKAINDELKAGLIGPAEYSAALAKVTTAYNEAVSGATRFEQDEIQLRQNMMHDLASTFSDFMVNGFDDAGKKLLDLQKNLAKQIMDFWIKKKIIIPMERRMKGGGGAGVNGGGDWSSGDTMNAVGMAGMVVGSAIGGQAGSILSGAAGGAMIGSEIFPGIGTAIGAVVGGLLGAFGGGGDKTPAFSIYGGGGYGQAQEQFTTSLGTFGERSWHSNFDGVSQVKDTISKFDTELAKMLDTTQLDATRAALARSGEIHYEGSNPQNVLKQHLDAAIDATMPKFKQFIDGMYSLQDRLNAFQGLLALQKDLDTLQDAIVQLSGSPAEKAANQLMQLDRAVTDAQDKLASAIKMRDPAEIVSAEQALKQAVTSRYQQEMQMLAQVRTAIAQLESQSYSFNLSIEQKLAAITGDFSGVIDTARGRMTDLQSQILGSTDPAEQMGLLNDFTGALDTWLSSSIQAVNDALNQQLAALEAQKQSITADENAQLQAINDARTAEQQRIADTNAARQAARQADQQYRQQQLQDLQKQLSLANQWASVLDSAQKTINQLTTGTTNPLGPYSQAASLEAIISARIDAVRNETGADQAKDAQQLIADLTQRLQLIQSGNLYQRSSPEYLEQYNLTLKQLAEVQGLAGPKASQVDLLQRQIDLLNSIGNSIGAGNITNSVKLEQLNKQEAELKATAQVKLDEIAKKEEELKAAAQAKIDALNAEAAKYYTWARTEAQAAEQKRHDELVAQLKAITGGLDSDSFIAQETAREVDLLNSIDKNLKDFLDSISAQTSGGTGGGGTGIGGGSGGGGGGGKKPVLGNSVSEPISISIVTTVNGTGMGSQDIADAVSGALADALPAALPAIRRGLKVA